MKQVMILISFAIMLLYTACSEDLQTAFNIASSAEGVAEQSSIIALESSTLNSNISSSLLSPSSSLPPEVKRSSDSQADPVSSMIMEISSVVNISSMSELSSIADESSSAKQSSTPQESSIALLSSETVVVLSSEAVQIPLSSSEEAPSSEQISKYSSPDQIGTHYVLPILGRAAEGEHITDVPGAYWGYWGDVAFSVVDSYQDKPEVATVTFNQAGGIYFKVDAGQDIAQFRNGEVVFKIHGSNVQGAEFKLEAGDASASVALSDYSRSLNSAGWQEVRIPLDHFSSISFNEITVLFGLHLGVGTFGITDIYWQGWFEGETPSSSVTELPSSTSQTGTDNYSPGAGWYIDWSDEFDGSSLNTNVWHMVQTDPPYNNEQQYYTNTHDQAGSNVWVDGGKLIIEARAEFAQGRDRTYNYTSGKIESQGGKSVQYGVVAARMKLPKGNGLWSAFWMLGSNVGSAGWPNCGEIDILEGKGRMDNYASAAIHRGFNGDMYVAQDYFLPAGQTVTNDYHVYSIFWTDQVIDFKVDNITFLSVYNEGQGESFWPFNQPFYFILNLAVGGNFDGGILPTSADLPARMEVDWVRSYKR